MYPSLFFLLEMETGRGKRREGKIFLAFGKIPRMISGPLFRPGKL